MKLPSCTVRTRTTAGLNVIVNDIDESRVALVTEIGSVYGPPPTRNSADGGETTTWAPAAGDVGVAGLGAAGAPSVGVPAAGAGAGAAAPGVGGVPTAGAAGA